MKSKVILYLILLVFGSTFFITLAIGSYAGAKKNSVLEIQKEQLFQQIKKDFQLFDKLLLQIEKDINISLEKAIISINNVLNTTAKREESSPRELKLLAQKYDVNEIFLINEKGTIFNTSFAPDLNFSLFIKEKKYTDFLKSIFGKGKIFKQRIGISDENGTINSYAYYSPPGTDYIIKVSVQIRDFITENYSEDYCKMIFKDLFLKTVKLNNYLQSFDIYRINDISGWSLINEGKRFSKATNLILEAKPGNEIKIKKGGTETIYFVPEMENAGFDFVEELYIELIYDFSFINRFVGNIIFYAICSYILIMTLVFMISSKLFDELIVKRVLKINIGLKNIENGDYNTELETSGKDELTTISKNIMSMSKKIQERESSLKKSRERYRTLQSNIHIRIFRSTPEGVFLSINPALVQMFGYESEEELKKVNMTDLYYKPNQREILLQMMVSQKIIKDFSIKLVKKDTSLFWGSISFKAISDDQENILYFDGSLVDITKRKKSEEMIRESLKEKEVLLREVHHRVKNNMQVISSLLSLQSRYIKNDDDLQLFKDSQNRVRSMYLVHEKLYNSKNLSKIDFADYINSLTGNLLISYKIDPDLISLNIMIKNVFMNINLAVPCSLLINELITNCLKHAFPDNRKGEISIYMNHDRSKLYNLTISDNGIGFPEDIDYKNTETLGLQLVETLIHQLKGSIKLIRKDGTTFKISFPEKIK